LRTPGGDVDFYVEEARRAGGPVLEMACGTGRVLVPTARAGVEIAGVDSSASMLDRARSRLAAEEAAVARRATLVHGDICTTDLAGGFALVTIPFRSIAHLMEVERQLALFRNVRRHLAPGGRLVFDFFQPNPAYLTGPRPEKLDLERAEPGRSIRRYSAFRPSLSRQVTEVTLRWEVEEPGGQVSGWKVTFPMRWYHRFELEHLLARSGLEVVSLFGDFHRGPFGDETWEMVFVAAPL
ncbi:MAG: class I SAM-dependent methyltransferase, partial [Planctomycetota bacterium]